MLASLSGPLDRLAARERIPQVNLASPAIWAPPIVLVAIGLALRLYGINRGLWEDEITVAYYTQLPLSKVISTVAQNGSHPPLYFLLARFDSRAGMDVVSSLRVPSLIAGLATIVVAYLIALKLVGRMGALVAGLLVTVAPFAIWYSQEGRMYSLVWFFVLASYLVLVWGHDSRAWAVFATLHAILIGLALWTDYSAALALLPQPLLIVLLRRRRWFLGSWAAGWILIVPWLFFLAQQYGRIQSQRFPGVGGDLQSWLGVLSDLTFVHAGYAAVPNPLPTAAIGLLLGLLVASAGATVYAGFNGRARIAVMAAACLTIGPLIIALALALHGTVAVVLPRVMGIIEFGVIFMFASAAAVLVATEWRPSRAAAAVGVAALLLCVGAAEADVAQHGTNGTGWETVAATIDDDAQPGDVLIYYPIATKLAVDPFLSPSSRWRNDYQGIWPQGDDFAHQNFANWTAGKQRVWFVFFAIAGVDMPQNDQWFFDHGLCRVMGDPGGRAGIIEYLATSSHC